ncbi:uncharacterized protein LOC103510718 [Diaphorina citri]|uniref:Uncharacterized protein LOC103510718 n=1 Tax=Diaphorina citri TaxID=121845 RepID=A0A3Q0IW75_DIACI|nr:uncharacterized protein LOC103510718 [Diaphorina citri]
MIENMKRIIVRGQSNYVLECQQNETVSHLKNKVASLEKVALEDFSLICSGKTLTDDLSISDLESGSIEIFVPLLGGKLLKTEMVQNLYFAVEKQEKKKKKTGRAKRRVQYNRRFVNVVQTFGRRRGPNANS